MFFCKAIFTAALALGCVVVSASDCEDAQVDYLATMDLFVEYFGRYTTDCMDSGGGYDLSADCADIGAECLAAAEALTDASETMETESAALAACVNGGGSCEGLTSTTFDSLEDLRTIATETCSLAGDACAGTWDSQCIVLRDDSWITFDGVCTSWATYYETCDAEGVKPAMSYYCDEMASEDDMEQCYFYSGALNFCMVEGGIASSEEMATLSTTLKSMRDRKMSEVGECMANSHLPQLSRTVDESVGPQSYQHSALPVVGISTLGVLSVVAAIKLRP